MKLSGAVLPDCREIEKHGLDMTVKQTSYYFCKIQFCLCFPEVAVSVLSY